MIPDLVDPQIQPTDRTKIQRYLRSYRLRVPVFACLAALLLPVLLLLAVVEIGPESRIGLQLFGSLGPKSALAAPPFQGDRPDQTDRLAHDEVSVHYGIVITRPEDKVGTWVINDTVYLGTVNTDVDGDLAVGACARVEVSESAPSVALKIDERDMSDCDDGDDSGGGYDGNDEYVIRYGLVMTRPQGNLGTWVIGQTSYTSSENTFVEGDLEKGACAEVKVAEDEPGVALRILEKDLFRCNEDDDNEEYVIRYGTVESRPAGKVGTWVISDVAYTGTENTSVYGTLAEGSCAEVKVGESAPAIAIRIIEKDRFRCHDQDDDGEPDRRQWEGTIFELPLGHPLTLLGAWTITVDEGEKVTFTTTLDTRFDPQLATGYEVGRWVEVKVIRQPNGTLIAEGVRVDDHELGEIVVRFENAAYSTTVASQFGLTLKATLLSAANIYLFTTSGADEQQLVEDVAEEDGVIWAEVNFVNSVPEDEGYKTWGWGGVSEPDTYVGQSAYQQIHWDLASRRYQGDGVVIAVLDTGVYTPHEQFAGRLQLPSLDVISDDNDPSDIGPGPSWGHGTHVAGIIAAMAPDAKILPVRGSDSNGRGNTFLLAYAIEWVARQPGVKVINLSLGTDFDSKILRDVIAGVVEQGIVVVSAAGNSNSSQVKYPAGYQDVVSVTAVDGNSQKASFANYGIGWVDISAPGVGIMSTIISEDGAGYATWSGTSMSTAFVSGAAALLAGKIDSQAADDDGLLDQLVNTGTILDLLNPLFIGQIGRLLDVSAALEVNPLFQYMPDARK